MPPKLSGLSMLIELVGGRTGTGPQCPGFWTSSLFTASEMASVECLLAVVISCVCGKIQNHVI